MMTTNLEHVWIVREVISGRVVIVARSQFNAVKACREEGYKYEDVDIKKWKLR